MALQESGEMYLETILILTEKKRNVRAIDIVNYTGYSKPSISRAISVLKNDMLLTVDANGFIILTEQGLATAQRIYERHKTLTAFLIQIGVNEVNAAEDACKIEHDISDDTFAKIKEQLLPGK